MSHLSIGELAARAGVTTSTLRFYEERDLISSERTRSSVGEPSALDGRYQWFGALVLVEVAAAVLGCWRLHTCGRDRWLAWWVALVVAAHFVPLAWLLSEPTFALMGIGLLTALAGLVTTLRRAGSATSFPVGVLMGGTLLTYAWMTGGPGPGVVRSPFAGRAPSSTQPSYS